MKKKRNKARRRYVVLQETASKEDGMLMNLDDIGSK
jgi:hypothetical protein